MRHPHRAPRLARAAPLLRSASALQRGTTGLTTAALTANGHPRHLHSRPSTLTSRA